MGNVHMEASQINYRGGETKMSVEDALKNTSGEAAAIAALQTAVGNLQSGKANLSVIAPAFSAETSYAVGDIVAYEGATYRCTTAHEGEWDAADFTATTISGELATLSGDVSDLNSTKANQITIAPFFSAEISYDPGDIVYYNGLSYRCVNAHEGEWDADDFAATTIDAELKSLNSNINDLSFIKNLMFERHSNAIGDKIPWPHHATGYILWAKAGMGSGSGILSVGADNTEIVYTSLSYNYGTDITAAVFDWANSELELKTDFIQFIAIRTSLT